MAPLLEKYLSEQLEALVGRQWHPGCCGAVHDGYFGIVGDRLRMYGDPGDLPDQVQEHVDGQLGEHQHGYL